MKKKGEILRHLENIWRKTIQLSGVKLRAKTTDRLGKKEEKKGKMQLPERNTEDFMGKKNGKGVSLLYLNIIPYLRRGQKVGSE